MPVPNVAVPNNALLLLALRKDTAPVGGAPAEPPTVAVSVKLLGSPLVVKVVIDGASPVTARVPVAEVLAAAFFVPTKTAL